MRNVCDSISIFNHRWFTRPFAHIGFSSIPLFELPSHHGNLMKSLQLVILVLRIRCAQGKKIFTSFCFLSRKRRASIMTLLFYDIMKLVYFKIHFAGSMKADGSS